MAKKVKRTAADAAKVARRVKANKNNFLANPADGKIQARSQYNIALALQLLQVNLSYDEFADRYIIQRGKDKARTLIESDFMGLWLECEREFFFLPPKEYWYEVVVDIARKRTFHPVLDYLASCKWDGTPRVETWLIRHAGAKDDPFVRAVSRLILMAAVRRVKDPGCKFDEILVLESAQQGWDKSSALAALCPNRMWFTDDLPLHSNSKTVIEQTMGKWLIEASDLSGMNKAAIEALKAFLSRSMDVARLAYAHLPTDKLRSWVPFGSTNGLGYLTDQTGNRRIWPVALGKRMDAKMIAAERDQLWAEACVLEAKKGAIIRLDPALYEAAGAEQDARRTRDAWEDTIEDVLGDLNGKLLASDAWHVVGQHDTGRRTQAMNARLGAAMRACGWERPAGGRRIDGRPQHCYVRGDAQNPDHQQRIYIHVPRNEYGNIIVGEPVTAAYTEKKTIDSAIDAPEAPTPAAVPER